MDIAAVDFAVRAATLTVFVLLAVILLRDQRDRLAAQLALLMTAAISCYVLGMDNRAGMPPFFFWVTWVGQCAQYGFFWLFAKVWFNDQSRVSRSDLLIVGGTTLYPLLTRILLDPSDALFWPTDLVMRIMWLLLVMDGLRFAWRGRGDDLVEARRRIRTAFVWITGSAQFIITVIYFFYNKYLGVPAPLTVQVPIDVAILLLSSGLFLAITGMRDPDLFLARPNGRPQTEMLDDEMSDAIVARLTAHMEGERAWRDERLTISTLAAQIGEQEYRLRRVINGRMGFRNFAAFLNGYRLAEVKEALADPEQKDVPILTIALDAGFGSLGPFNRAFREAEGMTPSAYRAVAGL